MGILQRDLHQQLRTTLIETTARIAQLVRPVDLARLNEHPEREGWSANQVMEHLCVAGEIYEVPLAAAFRSARADAGAPARRWRPSLLGRMIAGSLERSGKLKAPRLFLPGSTPRSGVLEALLMLESAFVKSMDDAASLDWRAVRLSTPALPSWVPKLNLGDAFKIHVVHVSRHSRQIERLVR